MAGVERPKDKQLLIGVTKIPSGRIFSRPSVDGTESHEELWPWIHRDHVARWRWREGTVYWWERLDDDIRDHTTKWLKRRGYPVKKHVRTLDDPMTNAAIEKAYKAAHSLPSWKRRIGDSFTPHRFTQLLEGGGKTLFIVHVEEAFRRFYNKTYLMRLRSLVMRPSYDRVIFLNSNVDHWGRMAELQDLRGEDWDWSWGYEPAMFDGDTEEQQWVIECPTPHQYTWVPPEMRGVTQAQLGSVSIMGGHGDECLADWEAVLRHCDVEYRRLEGLIYT